MNQFEFMVKSYGSHLTVTTSDAQAKIEIYDDDEAQYARLYLSEAQLRTLAIALNMAADELRERGK
jgi:hypothetical protein